MKWIIFSSGDVVSASIQKYDPNFSQQFTLVAAGPYGLQLYHLNGGTPLPNRPVSSYIASEQQFCNAKNYPSLGGHSGLAPSTFPGSSISQESLFADRGENKNKSQGGI